MQKKKLGIVKKGVDNVVSDNNVRLKKLFKKKIRGEHLLYLDDLMKIKTKGAEFSVYIKPMEQSYSFTSPLPGDYQARNAATAVLASLSYANRNGTNLYLPRWLKKELIRNVKENTG